MLADGKIDARQLDGLADVMAATPARGFDTLAAARSAIIPALVLTVQVGGYAAAWDAPIASYRRAVTQPAHPGRFQDAAGVWWELSGDTVDVRQLGAKGDCPDVSGVAGSDQATISAAVQAATNDVGAFRDAFRVAAAIGATKVTHGGFGRSGTRVYRIAYDNAVCSGLAIPPGVEWAGVDWSRIEVDYSRASIGPAFAATSGKAVIHNTIGLGDPFTQMENRWTGSTIDGYIVASGMLEAAFTDRVTLRGLDLRCHQRVPWRSELESSGWKGFGMYLRLPRGLRMLDCRFEGFPNAGCSIRGGYGNWIERCEFIRNGFGAVPNSDQNGLDIQGIPVQDTERFDSRDIFVGRCRFIENRDEGVAWTSVNRADFTDIVCVGNQDRAMEGFYESNQTALTFGREFPSKTYIRGFFHDGRYSLGKVVSVAAAGATTIVLDDAWRCCAQTQQGVGRLIFLPGATTLAAQGRCSILGNILTVQQKTLGAFLPGMVITPGGNTAAGQTIVEQLSGMPGGAGTYRLSQNQANASGGTMTASGVGDGPFRITAVDYATQTVTLDAAITNALAVGAMAYGKSGRSIVDGQGNEAHTELSGFHIRNLHVADVTNSPISFSSNDGGTAIIRGGTVESVTMTDTVNAAVGLIAVSRTEVKVGDVRVRGLYTTVTGRGVIEIGKAYSWSVTDLDCDGGHSHVVRVAGPTGANRTYAVSGYVGRCRSRGFGRAGFRVDGSARRVVIEGNDLSWGNADNQTTEVGVVNITSGTAVQELVLRRNTYRPSTSVQPPDAPVTYTAATSVAAVTTLICEDNDFPLGAFAYARQHGIPTCLQARTSGDALGALAATVREARNRVLGRRDEIVPSLTPASGTWRRGDNLLLDLPSASAADRARCVTSGTAGSGTGTTSNSALSTASTIAITSATGSGWEAGTIVTIPGGTNGGALTVVAAATPPGGSTTTVWLNDVLGAAVASGAVLATQSPVFKSAGALAA